MRIITLRWEFRSCCLFLLRYVFMSPQLFPISSSTKNVNTFFENWTRLRLPFDRRDIWPHLDGLPEGTVLVVYIGIDVVARNYRFRFKTLPGPQSPIRFYLDLSGTRLAARLDRHAIFRRHWTSGTNLVYHRRADLFGRHDFSFQRQTCMVFPFHLARDGPVGDGFTPGHDLAMSADIKSIKSRLCVANKNTANKKHRAKIFSQQKWRV